MRRKSRDSKTSHKSEERARRTRELLDAATSGNDHRIEQLLAGARPPLTEDEYEAFHCAAYHGHEKVVARLLAACPALIRAKGDHFQNLTAFQLAASRGHDGVVAQLLAADPALLDDWNMTALHLAAEGGHANVVARLLAAKPSLINETTCGKKTALHYAAEKGHEHVLSQLLAACPELINQDSLGGLTVLHYAAERGHDNLVAQILTLRPNVIDCVDGNGWTALMQATHCGHEAVARRLLAFKPALIDAVSKGRSSTLHFAIIACSKELVGELWRMNPQALRQANSHQNTPFDIAITNQRDDLIELFQWGLSLDELANAFTKNDYDSNKAEKAYQERYRPVIEQQCAAPLLGCLGQDVAGTVFEYLGFDPVKRPCKRNKKI